MVGLIAKCLLVHQSITISFLRDFSSLSAMRLTKKFMRISENVTEIANDMCNKVQFIIDMGGFRAGSTPGMPPFPMIGAQ